MTPEERERMNSLVSGIQQEKDYARFAALLRELNSLIARKELRFPQHSPISQRKRPWKTTSGVVQKIVKSLDSKRRENIEIRIAEAEELFREVRIENGFTDAAGQQVALKQGSHVDVTFEADENDTTKASI